MSVLQQSPRVSFIDPVSYAAQSIFSAAADLAEQVARAQTVDEALRLHDVTRMLRERLDVVVGQAIDRADAIIEAL